MAVIYGEDQESTAAYAQHMVRTFSVDHQTNDHPVYAVKSMAFECAREKAGHVLLLSSSAV